uniref:Uncharacterized protein n=2 Tax=Clastoptera arizonana TaxID=38151 RepID=A0A1B6DJC6_9HEMI
MEEKDILKGESSHENSTISEKGKSLEDVRSLEEYTTDLGDLINKLEAEDLVTLRTFFLQKETDQQDQEPRDNKQLSKDEFVNAIESIYGSDTYAVSAKTLFDEINENNNETQKGLISWNQILDVIISKMEKKGKNRELKFIRELLDVGRNLEDLATDTGDLIDKLSIEDLIKLYDFFFKKEIDPNFKDKKDSKYPKYRGFKLLIDEFSNAIQAILGTDIYAASAKALFEEITHNNNEGFIWWDQILDAIILRMERQDKFRMWSVIREPLSRLYSLSHCKKETIIRIVPLETQTSFCYVMVSKYGHIGIYDWKMTLLEQYEVKLCAQDGNRRRTTWLTDAVYLPDAATLLLSASDRSLHFFSATGLVHVPIFYVSGLQNVPICLNYTLGPMTDDPSTLLIGDDHGGITTMKFHQPQFCLFRRNSTDKMDKYFWKELKKQAEWVTFNVECRVHNDEVIKLEFIAETGTIISCSNDPLTALVIRHMTGKRAPYIFKISRGVRCFHLDNTVKILVTGSRDSVVRLWNPVMTNKPVASLFGHKEAVVDVRILRNLNAVLSMSKDATLKVWDIDDHYCLQSLPTLFPVYAGTDRITEFGVQTFYPGPRKVGPPQETDRKTNHILPVQKSHPASLLSGTSTIKQERTSDTNEVQWNRMEMLAVCCNFVVKLYLGNGDLIEGQDFTPGVILPPPLREQEPAVPSPWLTADPPNLEHLVSAGPSHFCCEKCSCLYQIHFLHMN